MGREAECRRLIAAIRNRESRLICGPADAGKTTLVKMAIRRLPGEDCNRCIYWSGSTTVRHLVGELVRLLYFAGDGIVQEKVRDDGASDASVDHWLREQTSGRLKILLYAAAQKGRYWFFLDHLPPPTRSLAKLIKNLIWRCKTPVYLVARGVSLAEIGFAWSIYFTPQYHISLGPLAESASEELLEQCIRRFGLASLDLAGFRGDILRLSGRLPGSIVKMCELAAEPRYRFGDQVKVQLVHVDYLLRARPSALHLIQGRTL